MLTLGMDPYLLKSIDQQSTQFLMDFIAILFLFEVLTHDITYVFHF
jgi:hypothetical protein